MSSKKSTKKKEKTVSYENNQELINTLPRKRRIACQKVLDNNLGNAEFWKAIQDADYGSAADILLEKYPEFTILPDMIWEG